MRINHNITALNTYRQLSTNTDNQSKSIEKLSSGLRINRAGDDAAGLAISEKMRGQIRGLDQASRNAQDGISMVQTAEGALNETHDILQRMKELATQSANGSNTSTDRGAIQDEVNQLSSEINRIGNTTEFNTQKLLNGGVSSNSSAKITQATSAKVTASAATSAATSATSITVDNQTFDLSGVVVGGITDANAKAAATALGAKTSGGTKLSDLVDITTDGSGKLIFTAKSTGTSSSISFSADDAALGITFATDKGTGTPTTMERAGLQAGTKFAATTIATSDKLSISVGGGTAVDVTFDTAKSYTATQGADFVKDLNAALQKSGLNGQVSASLSSAGKVQLISETGKDLTITASSGDFGAAKAGLAAGLTPANVQQVVGPGAEGSGFSTKFQIGANSGQSMSLTINDMRSAALGLTGNAGQAGFAATNNVTNGTTDVKAEAALDLSSADNASKAISVLDKAIDTVSSERAKMGAVQNRLEHTINNLNTSHENVTAAESRIRDVDMAKEMMNQSKNSILAQAAQAMLAQANQQPQGVLQLLR